jgi:hypothetical protein
VYCGPTIHFNNKPLNQTMMKMIPKNENKEVHQLIICLPKTQGLIKANYCFNEIQHSCR